MTYDIYNYIFIGALVLSIVMLIATVLIFFLLNIKNAIGEISGSNKRKAIENIHNNVSVETKKKTVKKVDYDKQTPSAKLAIETVETAKISPQDRYDSFEAGATTNLQSEPSSETTVLNAPQSSETTVLSDIKPEAEQQEPVYEPVLTADEDPDFNIEIDITYVHSNEVIR